jgi:hypothetical protein
LLPIIAFPVGAAPRGRAAAAAPAIESARAHAAARAPPGARVIGLVTLRQGAGDWGHGWTKQGGHELRVAAGPTAETLLVFPHGIR